MKNVIKTGIDTVSIEYSKDACIEKLLEDNCILDRKLTYTKDGSVRVGIKPSIVVNGGIVPTGLMETLKVVEGLEDGYGVREKERGRIHRMDIATDTKDTLENNIQLFRLFLECLAIKRRKDSKTVFETTKDITEKGNLKIKGRFVETTIYNSSDKARVGNARIENKVLEIRINGTNVEKARHEILKYVDELKGLEELVEKVEERYIDKLYSHYLDLTAKGSIKGFTEYVSHIDLNGWLLTTGVLKGLMKKVGMKSSYKMFSQKYRSSRPKGLSQLVDKKEVKDLANEIVKGLKLMLKEK